MTWNFFHAVTFCKSKHYNHHQQWFESKFQLNSFTQSTYLNRREFRWLLTLFLRISMIIFLNKFAGPQDQRCCWWRYALNVLGNSFLTWMDSKVLSWKWKTFHINTKKRDPISDIHITGIRPHSDVKKHRRRETNTYRWPKSTRGKLIKFNTKDRAVIT